MAVPIHTTVHKTVSELEYERSKFTTAALMAPNTQSGYRFDQTAFRVWARQMGFEPLPATPETLSLYVTSMLVRGLKVSTCIRRVCAIAHMHRSLSLDSPFTDEVRALLRGAKRIRAEQVARVLPLAIAELRAIALKLLAEDTPGAVRNWAILLTGFTGALRNSNTAALMLSDVEFSERGATLRIRKSKTDQDGSRAQLIALPYAKHPETCAAKSLQKWIARRGAFPGPLFTRCDGLPPKERGLLPERIGQIVQESIELIGKDSRLYGGHSLRAGFVTEAGESGASDLAIAHTTGHRDMSTLRQYFRKRDVWKGNVCNLMDL